MRVVVEEDLVGDEQAQGLAWPPSNAPKDPRTVALDGDIDGGTLAGKRERTIESFCREYRSGKDDDASGAVQGTARGILKLSG